jgi:hypothetical protein
MCGGFKQVLMLLETWVSKGNTDIYNNKKAKIKTLASTKKHHTHHRNEGET